MASAIALGAMGRGFESLYSDFPSLTIQRTNSLRLISDFTSVTDHHLHNPVLAQTELGNRSIRDLYRFKAEQTSAETMHNIITFKALRRKAPQFKRAREHAFAPKKDAIF